MRIVESENWAAYRSAQLRFSQLDRERRSRWWFRGQGNFADALVPTIDRTRKFATDVERERFISELIREFRREAISLGAGGQLPRGEAFELLARHHGLPSPYLDWTRSPYVAACFAFLDSDESEAPEVAIFALDRSKIDPVVIDPAARQLELIDEPENLLFNRRAVQQRGVFMRRSTAQRSVEDLLGDSLFKFKIPASQRSAALLDLDQAMVNATTLYYDLDGAARTASWRCA